MKNFGPPEYLLHLMSLSALWSLSTCSGSSVPFFSAGSDDGLTMAVCCTKMMAILSHFMPTEIMVVSIFLKVRNYVCFWY